jgi:hypothetical protein
MPQPTLLRPSGRSVAKFGGLALPHGQGVLAQIDLNDYVNTAIDGFDTDEAHQLSLAQLLYRGRGVFTAEDWGPRQIRLPMVYREDATHFLGAFLAALSQAGEQQITFDNLTYLQVKFDTISNRQATKSKPPFGWTFALELIAADPWWRDLAPTTMAPLVLTVDAGQNFNIAAVGSIWAEPIFTLVVPVTNTVAINSMQLKNTMSGEFLTVNFLSYAAIPALTARTITIDCAASTAIDDLGHYYDTVGSFPKLYPPPGQVNPFTVIITPASGSTAGLTLAASHTPRWQI